MNYSFSKTLAVVLGLSLLTAACKKDKKEDTPAPVVTNGMSYKLDGATITPTTVAATYSSNTLTITGNSANPTKTLQISVPGVTAAGTFNDTGTILYTEGTQTSVYADTVNVVTITELNTTTKKVSGTFTATVVPFIGNPATTGKVITAGTFTSVGY